MGRLTNRFVWFAVAVAVLPLATAAFAQERVQEKDAPYLQPSRESVVSSSLCQQARERASEMDPKTGKTGVVHYRELEPGTLESDLAGLMAVSEDVVLAGISTRDAAAPSPSKAYAIHSFQVKVLHVWKGRLKVGQTIVFSLPSAALHCAEEWPVDQGPTFENWTGDEHFGPGGYPGGPFVLFLRRAQGAEMEVTPDLRLAGGDGTQGLFYTDYFVSPKVALAGQAIPHEWPAWYFDSSLIASRGKQGAGTGWSQLSMAERFKLIGPCNGVLNGSIEKCLAYMTTGRDWILLQHQTDPLFKKYEGMESGKFFEEMDSAARSLGLATLLVDRK